MSDEGLLQSLFGKFYYDESLRPPPESGDGQGKDDDSWDWREALVDNAAYMIDERNHTTARCPIARKVRGGGVKQDMMQVTFCLSRPPRVSYFCMSYTSRDPSQFRCEPTIFAAEGNLAVIGLIHNWTFHNARSCVYFVYRAPIHGNEGPLLTLLPHPPSQVFPEQHESECQLGHNEIGILRYRSASTLSHKHSPAPALARRRKSHTIGDGHDAYKIATLCKYGTNDQYVLYTYDSVAEAWTRTPAAFPRPQDAPPEHLCNRVITGGGTMGWVDLWHGILLCDVHVPSPAEDEESPGPRLLRYVPVPEPMQPDNDLRLHGLSSYFRDIAVVNGRIKFVDLQLHASPGSRTPNGWTAVTWSMAPGDSGFTKDGELNSRDMVINPMEPSLFVAHPTLSSYDDDVLYLMTKTSLDDIASQVIAVNMKNKKLERAAKYTTQRDACMDFAYKRTTISYFLARGTPLPFH